MSNQVKDAIIVHARKELEEASRPLLKFMGTYGGVSDTSSLSASNDPPSPAAGARQITGQIVTRLQTWISMPTSQTLCIISPPFSSNRLEATIAAHHVISVVQSTHTPYLAVVIRRLEPSSDVLDKTSQSMETARLVLLLYTLIRQLTLLVPKSLEETSSITALLESLDGTTQSIPAALNILQVLLRHAPSLLFCVIDGMQLIDFPELEQYVNDLLKILRARDDGKVFKVLLTSEGYFSSAANLDVEERLNCLHSPRRGAGSGQPGARFLHDVSLPF